MTSIMNTFEIFILKLIWSKPLRKYFNKYVSKEELSCCTLDPLIGGVIIRKGTVVWRKAYVTSTCVPGRGWSWSSSQSSRMMTPSRRGMVGTGACWHVEWAVSLGVHAFGAPSRSFQLGRGILCSWTYRKLTAGNLWNGWEGSERECFLQIL